jgi:6-phosphogluconolactonase (cycloisomerase 2 family)
MNRLKSIVIGLFFAVLMSIGSPSYTQEAGTITRITTGFSRTAGGERGVISADGRYVVFISPNKYLVPNDTNNDDDVVMYDHQTGQLSFVSLNSDGVQSNYGYFSSLDISADGRYVAFVTDSTNLVPNDTNNRPDVFVRDMQLGLTTRVSVDSNGVQSDSPNFPTITPIVHISRDGRYIVFSSDASNLVPNDTNNTEDVFLHDRQTGQTTRISVDSNEVQGIQSAIWYQGTAPNSISDDGRYVSFSSEMTNLVPNDTNGFPDVFVRDTQAGTTIRISEDELGNQGNHYSGYSSLSADGRYIVFDSLASNLIPNDTNNVTDVFVRDLQTGQIERVSVDSAGIQANEHSYTPHITGDGRYVLFTSDAKNLIENDTDVTRGTFRHDRTTGETIRIPFNGNGGFTYYTMGISDDGNRFAITSDDVALVAEDYNWMDDVFMRDIALGITIPISAFPTLTEVGANDESYLPSISDDGRFITFLSSATNFIPESNMMSYNAYFYDRQTTQITTILAQVVLLVSISGDGNTIIFVSPVDNLVPNDTYNSIDVFAYDRLTTQITRVSVNSEGIQSSGMTTRIAVSDDGRHVVFTSAANGLVANDTNGKNDIFVHDRQTGQTTRVSVSSNGTQGNEYSNNISISSDGRYVAFSSSASNLVANDTNGKDDIFVHDRQTGQTTRISVSSNSAQGNDSSTHVALSDDGRYVAFTSYATNLVAGDTNSASDVFVHDRQTGITSLISKSTLGIQGNAHSYVSDISGDGNYVAVLSTASNLVANDTNASMDTFLYNRTSERMTIISMTASGIIGNNESRLTAISDDGLVAVFESDATNFVTAPTDSQQNIFVHELMPPLPTPPTPTLLTPTNGSTLMSPSTELTWAVAGDATSYHVQVATDSTFRTPLYDQDIITTTFPVTFSTSNAYYWRVRAKNANGFSTWSATYQFNTSGIITVEVGEQALFQAIQPNLVDPIEFVVVDIQPTGIFATIQFTDGIIATTMVTMTLDNQLIRLTVDNPSIPDGTSTHIDAIYQQLPALVMSVLNDLMPTDYLYIQGMTFSEDKITFSVVIFIE